jgi:RNA polymerase sigma-70 factor, ECF subfamily
LEPIQVAKLVSKNDDESRRMLFEAYYKRTFAVAYNILRRRESAEDITQDAFIKAFQNLHQLHDKEKFGAWLAVIASNLSRNYLKREKRIILTEDLPVIESGAAADNTEESALRALEVDRIRGAIRNLPSEQYQVIVLQYFHDLKVDEIAGMLKISPGTVKSRLFRARQKLAVSLEREDDPDCLIIEGGGREQWPKSKDRN